MAIVFMTQAPNREAYEHLSEMVEAVDERPPGCLVHTASEMADGSVRVVDVWESQEALDAFGQKLGAAMASIGIDPEGGPAPDAFETFRVL